METIIYTVIGVLIAQKLAYAYQIWRSCSRYRAVEAYALHVRLAARSAQRLALYKRGHRIPTPSNPHPPWGSQTVAWHILVATPEEAEATIQMHCNYIVRHEGRMSAFAAEADFETRKLISNIRKLCEHSDFNTTRDWDLLDRKLSELHGRMRDVKSFHEKERCRITDENNLTIFISKPFMRYRRLHAIAVF